MEKGLLLSMENSTFFKTCTISHTQAIFEQLPTSSGFLPCYADVVPFPVICRYSSYPLKRSTKELSSVHLHNNLISFENVRSLSYT